MDHKLMGIAVCNGIYSHSNIAMALYVLETLDTPQRIIDEVEAYLYSMRAQEPSTTDEA